MRTPCDTSATPRASLSYAAIAAMAEKQSRPAMGVSSPAEPAVLHGVVADLRKLLDCEVARRRRAETRNDELTLAAQKADRARVAADRDSAALRAEIDALEAHIASRATRDAAETGIDSSAAHRCSMSAAGRTRSHNCDR